MLTFSNVRVVRIICYNKNISKNIKRKGDEHAGTDL